jgi:erythromycin esterase
MPRTFCIPSIVLIALIAAQRPASAQDAADVAPAPPPCQDGAGTLTLTRPWQARLDAGTAQCLVVRLEAGDHLRAVVSLDARAPLTGATAQLFEPGDAAAAVQAVLGNENRRALTLEARRAGTHYLVIRDAWTIDRSVVGGVPVRAWIEAVEPATLVQARRHALARDARVAWLRDHAHRLQGIEPGGDDHADLEPLRTMLDGVRVVMLGESSHYAGSDLAAKSRIVRFLHQEMGFDVLAMEAGMFGMAAANDALRAGVPGQQAFALGAWPFWAHVEQMQPLIAYAAASARGPTPLTLAGFDIQFVRPGAAERFPADLAAFLDSHGIVSPVTDPDSRTGHVLESLAMVHYRTGVLSYPDADTRSAFVDALDDLIGRVSALDGRDAQLWHRILRSVRAEATLNFARAEGADLWEASRIRNRMMGENLVWLATELYPDRRIIAWAGNAHVMRLAEIHPAGGEGPSMGTTVREELGDESFVVAVTSFEGPMFAADQHPLPDFETLMAEAGFDYGVVDLRAAARDGTWLGGPFLARAVSQASEERVWSDVADALLFIRRYEPSRRIPPPP